MKPPKHFLFFVVRFRFILAMNRREEARKHKSLDTVALIKAIPKLRKVSPRTSLDPTPGGRSDFEVWIIQLWSSMRVLHQRCRSLDAGPQAKGQLEFRHFQPCQKRVAGQTSFSGGIWESLMVCIGATSRLRAVFIGGMAAETSTNVSRFQRDSWRVERGPDLYLKQTMTMAMTFLTWRADIMLLISCTRERMEQHRWFLFG